MCTFRIHTFATYIFGALLQVDAVVAKFLEEEAQQLAALSGCRPEFGGAAESLAAVFAAVA